VRRRDKEIGEEGDGSAVDNCRVGSNLLVMLQYEQFLCRKLMRIQGRRAAKCRRICFTLDGGLVLDLSNARQVGLFCFSDQQVVHGSGQLYLHTMQMQKSARPHVILVHGAANSSLVWRYWQEQLVELGWSTHAVDLRGHVAGPVADLSTVSMEDYADAVAQLAKQFSRKPVLIG
jgi:predicted alpha/beta-fold hydrolase